MSCLARSSLALIGAGALAYAACDEPGVHLFFAQRYDAARDCVEASVVIDVVNGNDPGLCEAVRCFVSPAGEVYVTTVMCDAPPEYVEDSAPAPGSVCALALAAREAERACPEGEGGGGGGGGGAGGGGAGGGGAGGAGGAGGGGAAGGGAGGGGAGGGGAGGGGAAGGGAGGA